MLSEILIITGVSAVFFVIAVIEIFVFLKNKRVSNELIKMKDDARNRMYEITILNKLSGRMGYPLSARNIIEIIIGSLPDIVDYSAASYMLFLPEKIIFNSYLAEPVSAGFIDEVKEKMLKSASALLNVDFKNFKMEEELRGSPLKEEPEPSVGSFFNIPLTISGEVVGLINVSHAQRNFYGSEEMTVLYKIASRASEAVTRLEELIRLENSKLNAMVASMADGVIMTDINYKIIVANPAARKAAGFENEGNLSIQDFIDGFNGKIDLKDRIEEAVRIEKVFISEELSVGGRFFKVIVSPVTDRSNWRTLGCVVVFRDITKEKEIERIKEDFTSMIVHELRSPLDSIKKMIELMRGSGIKKAKQAECFQMIYGSSSDMLELVNNLLDMAKIEAGKFDLTKQPSDIKEIVRSRISFFDITAKDAKVTISSKFGKVLPSSVSFDPHMISEVLNNLISNAMKFNIENGSVAVQVLFYKEGFGLQKEAKDSGINWFIKKDIFDIPDSLFIAVTNDGAGIAKDQISQLFNKFVQVKSVFAKKGGTGLGLAITKSIIESHGGTVGVESTEGKGATFYFTLPTAELNKSVKAEEVENKIPVKIK